MLGLFDSGPDWECTKCGKVHSSNPEECKNCGHTILQQARNGASSNSATAPLSAGGGSSSANSEWMCSKCGHVHSRKPFTCDECGGSALREIPVMAADARQSESSRWVDIVAILLLVLAVAVVASYFVI